MFVALLIGIGIIVLIVVLAYQNKAAQAAREAARKNAIYDKYGHTEIASRIIAGSIWQGQTAEQLRDARGRPADIDEKVLKTKTKETWKYVPRGGNRYGLRITVENGIVVGWDERL